MGDGMSRLLGIALSLMNARAGFLLIDEVENGIHYSVQADIWRLILRNAGRLGVQVFATTHSWDCILAFQQACEEFPEGNGIATRLEFRRGRIAASQFDQNDLKIAAREHIEIR